MSTMIAPSILSADFARLGEEIKAVADAGADLIHIDVMDGHFVPNLTIGAPVVKAIKKINPPPLDVHLMIENPENYIDDFAKAGADYITVHQEACVHLHKVVTQIKATGAKAGVALNPGTPLSTLDDVIEMLDLILVMSVNPGFGGQSFIENSLNKCQHLNNFRKEYDLNFKIEVDGGVTRDNARALKDAGVDILVAGSAVFGKDSYQEAITAIREA